MPRLVPVRASTLRPPKLPVHDNGKAAPYTRRHDLARDDKYAMKGSRVTALPFLVVGFSLGWLMSTVLTPDLMFESIAISGDSAQVGYVHDVFSRQGISHRAFHTRSFKLRLMELIIVLRGSSGRIAVAGTQHRYSDGGHEVGVLADMGYEVHAFEPLQHYYEYTRKLSESNSHWLIHLHKVALGNISGGSLRFVHPTTNTKYRRGSIEETVPRAQIDDYISSDGEELDVLSVDVRGKELEVLQGARNLLDHGSIRMLWIEITPCAPETAALFRLLENRYIIFDLVPRGVLYDGKRKKLTTEIVPLGNGTIINRPHKHAQYLSWLCDAAKNGKKRQLMQVETDIVAVRKQLVTTQLLEGFSTIANDAFVGSLDDVKRLKGRRRR